MSCNCYSGPDYRGPERSCPEHGEGEPIIWVDVETTGLNPDFDVLLEIAIVVTGGDLVPWDEPLSLVILPRFNSAYGLMPDVVRAMHTRNGLIEEIEHGAAMRLEAAAKTCLGYVSGLVPEPRTAPLAGNNVPFDRSFLRKWMPDLEAYAHYRNIDVSTIKELMRRWHPDQPFEKKVAHRALPDILESIEELKFYKPVRW